jgi:F-type H+-transporting ATPase subunit epsilon
MINFKIVTPDKMIEEGKANMIIVPGIEGQLGFLPNHTPMLSMLKSGKVWIKQDKNYKEIGITGGFVEMCDNNLVILTHEVKE